MKRRGSLPAGAGFLGALLGLVAPEAASGPLYQAPCLEIDVPAGWKIGVDRPGEYVEFRDGDESTQLSLSMMYVDSSPPHIGLTRETFDLLVEHRIDAERAPQGGAAVEVVVDAAVETESGYSVSFDGKSESMVFAGEIVGTPCGVTTFYLESLSSSRHAIQAQLASLMSSVRFR